MAIQALSDRWLLLGLGILGFLAAKGVAYGLNEVVRLTEITKLPTEKPKPKTARRIPRSAEDAIKTESLELLATSSNVEIRKAATKILCDRFLRNADASAQLSEDFNCSDPNVKEQVAKIMDLLERHVNNAEWSRFADDNDIVRASQSLNLTSVLNGRSRLHVDSPEELALRRRRREAMVLNEGDRPVSQNDIIQRGGEMRDNDTQMTEQALADLA